MERPAAPAKDQQKNVVVLPENAHVDLAQNLLRKKSREARQHAHNAMETPKTAHARKENVPVVDALRRHRRVFIGALSSILSFFGSPSKHCIVITCFC